MTKPLGERVARMEEAFEHVKSELKGLRVDMTGGQGQIIERLDKVNDSVAKNTHFRLQQKAVYGVIGAAFTIAMVPLTAIAVAVLA